MGETPLGPADPAVVGGYTLLGRLGAGGMGVVYLAEDGAGRRVAVKLMRAEFAEDALFRQRFAREVEALRAVDGPHTARVLDVGDDGGRLFLVTEYVPGPSLAQQIATGPLPEEVLRSLAAALARALASIHAAGVVHRDLKPSNVLLAPDGPRVIDFGIAQIADATALTRTGTGPGTPGYLAPEQIHGIVGPAADVFAWAMTLAHAATGRPPFGTGPADVLLYRTVHAQPDLAGAPAWLLPVLIAAGHADPVYRPTAAQLAHHLHTAEPLTIPYTRPAGPALGGERLRARRRTRRVAGTVMAAATLTAAGVAAFTWPRPGTPVAQTPPAVTSPAHLPAATATPPSASRAGTVTETAGRPSPGTASAPADPRTSPGARPAPPPYRYLPEAMDCTPREDAQVDGVWQTFVPTQIRAGDAVELGLRDKYGNLQPRFPPQLDVLVRVYLPDGTSRLARSQVVSDTAATVVWPGDFSGAPASYPTGVYTIVWTSGDGADSFIACMGFTAR